MDGEVKQKLEVNKSKGVNLRLELPKSIHRKVKKHQYKLTGKPTMADAALDLISKGLETATL